MTRFAFHVRPDGGEIGSHRLEAETVDGTHERRVATTTRNRVTWDVR
jgi:hypothetical protein